MFILGYKRRVAALTLVVSGLLMTACSDDSSSRDSANSVTISGLVTDMPIADAQVTATVDGVTYEAAARTDATGAFEIEISSATPDALVQLEAITDDGIVEFIALERTFQAYFDEANNGTTPETNITNVTTAQFLLAVEQTVDGTIDDLAELTEASAAVDPNELLDVATAIKVVVDSVDGVILPAEHDSVLDLAQGMVDGTSNFIAELETNSPTTMDTAQQALLDDTALTLAFEADAVVGVLHADEGQMMVIFGDGVGLSSFGTESPQAISWQIDSEGKLQIEGETQSLTVTLFSSTGDTNYVHVDGVDVEGLTELQHEAITTLPQSEAIGSYLTTTSAPVYRLVLESGDGMNRNTEDGTEDDLFTWQINSNGGLLMTDDGAFNEDQSTDQIVAEYVLSNTAEGERRVLQVTSGLESENLLSLNITTLTYLSEIVEGPDVAAINTANLTGKTYFVSLPFDYRVVTFGPNGTAELIYQTSENGDNLTQGQAQGTWSVDGDGMLTMSFTETSVPAKFSDNLEITSGLGDAQMTLLDSEGIALEYAQSSAFDGNELMGAWFFYDNLDQTSPEFVVFNEDGTGQRTPSGQEALNLNWVVEEGGDLVVTWQDAASVQHTERFMIVNQESGTVGNWEALRYTTVAGEVVDTATESHFYPRVLTPILITPAA